MRSSQTTFVAAVAWAWLGAAACDSSPTSQSTAPLENGALNPADSSKTADPSSCATGGSSGSASCKTASDATGAACKVCWDASGAIIYDGCGAGGTAGAGGSGGAAGAGGTSGAGGSVVKCGTTTDPTTNAECQLCYNADGTVASTDCKTPPPGPGGSGGTSGSGGTGGSDVACTATTDATGVVCKICVNADGSVLSKDCTPAPTPSPTVSCVAATDIDSGQLCKVCSDPTGKVLFVDCDGEPPPSTSTPPTK